MKVIHAQFLATGYSVRTGQEIFDKLCTPKWMSSNYPKGPINTAKMRINYQSLLIMEESCFLVIQAFSDVEKHFSFSDLAALIAVKAAKSENKRSFSMSGRARIRVIVGAKAQKSICYILY